jgi:hypothetical protein
VNRAYRLQRSPRSARSRCRVTCLIEPESSPRIHLRRAMNQFMKLSLKAVHEFECQFIWLALLHKSGGFVTLKSTGREETYEMRRGTHTLITKRWYLILNFHESVFDATYLPGNERHSTSMPCFLYRPRSRASMNGALKCSGTPPTRSLTFGISSLALVPESIFVRAQTLKSSSAQENIMRSL